MNPYEGKSETKARCWNEGVEWERNRQHDINVEFEALKRKRVATPAPADGDLVRRLAAIIVTHTGFVGSANAARAVLAAMATFAGAGGTIGWMARAVEAEATIATLEAELKERKESTEFLSRQLGKENQRATKAESDLATVTRERDELHGELCNANDKVRDLTRELDDAKSLVDVWKNNAIGFSGTIDSLTRKLAEVQSERDELKTLLPADVVNAENAQLSKELGEAREELRLQAPLVATARNARWQVPGLDVDLSALDAHRARQKPDSGGERSENKPRRVKLEPWDPLKDYSNGIHDSGGERACVADEGGPAVGDTVELVAVSAWHNSNPAHYAVGKTGVASSVFISDGSGGVAKGEACVHFNAIDGGTWGTWKVTHRAQPAPQAEECATYPQHDCAVLGCLGKGIHVVAPQAEAKLAGVSGPDARLLVPHTDDVAELKRRVARVETWLLAEPIVCADIEEDIRKERSGS